MKMPSILFLLIPAFLLFSGCSSTKRTKKYISKGKYDDAIALAVKKLEKNKNSKDSESHIRTLEEAYIKATAEDLKTIDNAKRKLNGPGMRTTAGTIYYTYRKLIERQNKIRKLLPLRYPSGREAVFQFDDYTNNYLDAGDVFADALYSESQLLINTETKQAYRDAFGLLDELTLIRPGYKNAEQLKADTYYWGTDFVLVTLNNYSGMIIPWRLEEELLNFEAYNLNSFWIEYHSTAVAGIIYSYAVDLDFESIKISPELIREEEFTRKKEIKTGTKEMKDRQGDVVLDDQGNPVHLDVFKEVTATIKITEQEKSAFVGATVRYRDLANKNRMSYFPLASEFIFINRFAEYQGSRDALTSDDLKLIKNRFLPFPSSEQMVFDAGADIKAQFAAVLKDYPVSN